MAAMPHLHLVIPALLLPAAAALLPVAPKPLPAFGMLFGRGDLRIEAGTAADHWIAARFGTIPAHAAPLAALALLGSGRNPGSTPWLRADPVHLHPHGTTLTLVRSADTAVTQAEAEALCATLNRLFESDGVGFEAFPTAPDAWYVSLPSAPALRTTPVDAVRGLGIDRWLPTGDDARLWQRRMTEAQMVLHDHPVNQAREAAGRLPVNSLWLWGEGALGAPVSSPFAAVFADDASTRGFGVHAGVPTKPVPPDLNVLMQDLTPGEILVRMDALADARTQGDPDAVESILSTLDASWIAPGLAAVRSGRLARLTVTAVDRHRTVSVTAARSSLRRFWRRPVTLAALAVPPADNDD